MSPQISGSFAHGLDGAVELFRRHLSGVGHVLGQEVLKSLANRVAGGDDSLATIVSCTAKNRQFDIFIKLQLINKVIGIESLYIGFDIRVDKIMVSKTKDN